MAEGGHHPLPNEDPWVPPNDRQLALRAKLNTGWSVKSKQINSPTLARAAHQQQHQQLANGSAVSGGDSSSSSSGGGGSNGPPMVIQPLSEAEQEKVLQVIKRAEKVVSNEHERVGKLVDRVHNIQRNAIGEVGPNQCALCGDHASLLSWGSSAHVTCKDCEKSVCQKCSVDTTYPGHHQQGSSSSSSSSGPHSYLCKLCSERREAYKKSGAWFYK